ncbi:hypothetical protein KBA27_00145 [bacterium]|nr:hypothetical protein [bacterium]
MKKILIVFIFLMMFILPVSAKSDKLKKKTTVFARALVEFSSLYPEKNYKVETLEPIVIDGTHYIQGGAYISGVVSRVYPPQHGKKSAYFEFVPTSIIYNDEPVEGFEPASYICEINEYSTKGGVKKRVLKVVVDKTFGMFTKGIAFIEGVYSGDNGYRLKNGVKRVYDQSFVSNVQLGQEININKNDYVVLKFKKRNY